MTHRTHLPSLPRADGIAFDVGAGAFRTLGNTRPSATMDHRALAACAGRLYTVGGMAAGPAVVDEVWSLRAR